MPCLPRLAGRASALALEAVAAVFFAVWVGLPTEVFATGAAIFWVDAAFVCAAGFRVALLAACGVRAAFGFADAFAFAVVFVAFVAIVGVSLLVEPPLGATTPSKVAKTL